MKSRILERYLAKNIYLTTLLVSLMIFSILLLVNFIQETEELSGSSLSLWQTTILILLDLPGQLYPMFPILGLIGSLMGLSVLASHSELIAMRASGLSIARITYMIAKAFLLLIIIITIIGETLIPMAEDYAQNFRTTSLGKGKAVRTSHGLWLKDGNQVININTVVSKKQKKLDKHKSDQTLQDIRIYEMDGSKLTRTKHAKVGRFSKDDNKWHLIDVQASEVSLEGVKSEKLGDIVWDVALDPTLLSMGQENPSEMLLPSLFKYIQYRKANKLDAAEFGLTFWQRVYQPLASFVMMLLAIPFIFGPLRSATMGFRLIAGISLGFTFYILNQLFPLLSTSLQFSPIIICFIPTLIFSLLGVFLIRNVH